MEDILDYCLRCGRQRGIKVQHCHGINQFVIDELGFYWFKDYNHYAMATIYQAQYLVERAG